MTPTDFVGSNITLQPPAGMADCDPIRAHLELLPQRSNTHAAARLYTTMWQPTAEELDRLKAGMPVQISVYGHFPPMTVGVAQPVPLS